MGRACSTNVEKRNACRIFMGKPEEKTSLGRPRCTKVDNIKMYIRGIVWGGIDWIDLVQNCD
jgi:hypothetical protein